MVVYSAAIDNALNQMGADASYMKGNGARIDFGPCPNEMTRYGEEPWCLVVTFNDGYVNKAPNRFDKDGNMVNF
jgi:hypothetical protein